VSEQSVNNPLAPAASPETVRFLRMAEVVARTGRSRSTIYRDIEADNFPAPVELGTNSIAFIEAEVVAWQQSRIATRDAKAVAA
jgi:prophage regulatory protein